MTTQIISQLLPQDNFRHYNKQRKQLRTILYTLKHLTVKYGEAIRHNTLQTFLYINKIPLRFLALLTKETNLCVNIKLNQFHLVV